MFNLENLYQGKSLKHLETLGGTEELMRKLSTSLIVIVN